MFGVLILEEQNIVNGCGAGNGLVNGQGLDGRSGIGVASEF